MTTTADYLIAILVAWLFPIVVMAVIGFCVWRRERRVQRQIARLPLAPIVPLDLSRARRRQVARRQAGRRP
jgi:hypothetical protein